MVELRDVVLDTRSRVVTKAGHPVTLTAREYAILEYLALHRGEVVTRTALYEHLFDESDDTLSNLLDVHIFSIRKKLGPELIATRRGQGYCIES
jgi:two-component system OmpR family response regulator